MEHKEERKANSKDTDKLDENRTVHPSKAWYRNDMFLKLIRTA